MTTTDRAIEEDNDSDQEDAFLCESMNLFAHNTGLTSAVLWVSPEQDGHSPRALLCPSKGTPANNCLPIYFDPDWEPYVRDEDEVPTELAPGEVDRAIAWVTLNKNALLRLWSREIDAVEFCRLMVKV